MSSFSIKARPTYVLASLCLLAPRDNHPILLIHLEVLDPSQMVFFATTLTHYYTMEHVKSSHSSPDIRCCFSNRGHFFQCNYSLLGLYFKKNFLPKRQEASGQIHFFSKGYWEQLEIWRKKLCQTTKIYLFSAKKKFPAIGAPRPRLSAIFEMSPRALATCDWWCERGLNENGWNQNLNWLLHRHQNSMASISKQPTWLMFFFKLVQSRMFAKSKKSINNDDFWSNLLLGDSMLTACCCCQTKKTYRWGPELGRDKNSQCQDFSVVLVLKLQLFCSFWAIS